MSNANATPKLESFIVNDTLGVLLNTFVEGIAVSSNELGIKRVSGASVNCIGVVRDTTADGIVQQVAVAGGSPVRVSSDGTVAVGDFVTNDEDGKATPITVSATPTEHVWSHGVCLSLEKGIDYADLCVVELNEQQLYV